MDANRDDSLEIECSVYLVMDEAEQIGRVIGEVAPTGDARWRIDGDPDRQIFHSPEEAAEACLKRCHARGSERFARMA